MVTVEDIAQWKFGGDQQAFKDFMQRNRGGMQAFYRLDAFAADATCMVDATERRNETLTAESELLSGECITAWAICMVIAHQSLCPSG